MSTLATIDNNATGTLALFDTIAEMGHEQVVMCYDKSSGYRGVIAVHDTTLGPALGGARFWQYASDEEAIIDALRLSRGMTYKNAVAGLNLGGGKSVIIGDNRTIKREMIFRAHGRFVDSLGGRYITAEDVGTSPADMRLVATRTEHLVGLPEDLGGLGDPSPFTALGVHAAMRAAVEHRFGTTGLDGRSVAVVGAGHVGEALARMLAADGARVIVSDIDEAKRALVDELPGATWMSPGEAMLADADVLAPCALGGALDDATVPRLGAGIVCGAANNQLAHDALAEDLARRGIDYAPDFVANAGGLMRVAAELEGADGEGARERIAGIEALMRRILTEAAGLGITPFAAAHAIAERRLAGPLATV